MTEDELESIIEVVERSLRENGEGALVTIEAYMLGNLIEAAMRITSALHEAIPHIYRQQFAGKHEQDREDARMWLDEFADVRRALER